jgi:hypothetical protein
MARPADDDEGNPAAIPKARLRKLARARHQGRETNLPKPLPSCASRARRKGLPEDASQSIDNLVWT